MNRGTAMLAVVLDVYEGGKDLIPEWKLKEHADWASIPVVVVYTKDLGELHRYIEYPAIYHKDTIRGQQQKSHPGETAEQTRERYAREFLALQNSP